MEMKRCSVLKVFSSFAFDLLSIRIQIPFLDSSSHRLEELILLDF